jgi:hypothetical protein
VRLTPAEVPAIEAGENPLPPVPSALDEAKADAKKVLREVNELDDQLIEAIRRELHARADRLRALPAAIAPPAPTDTGQLS